MTTKQYRVTRTIDAPPETVWALLTDAASYKDWNPAVVSIAGPITTGSVIKLVSIVSPKRTFKLKVTVMEPPRQMVWSDGMPLGLFKGERTYLLQDCHGCTEFSMTEVFTGLLSGLISKSVADLTDSLNRFADGLKTAAEREAREAS